MQPASFLHLTLAILSLLLTGCAAAPQSAALLQSAEAGALLPATVLLDDVPFYPQEDYQCGPAALATLLQASRVSVTPDALVSQVYVTARQGSLQIEMLAAPRRYGRVTHVLPPDLEGVLREVQGGRPVLVMQNLGLDWYPQWHYAVVVGYDLNAGDVILRSGLIRDYRLGLQVFERTWQRAGHWAMLVLPPGEMPLHSSEAATCEAVAAFASAQVLLEQGHLEEAEIHARRAVALGGEFAETYRGTLRSVEAARAR